MHHTLLRKELGMLKAVIGANGRGESDTLTITAYATLRPVLDSIAPAVIARGANVSITLYARHGHYPTLRPVLPPSLLIQGRRYRRQCWATDPAYGSACVKMLRSEHTRSA